jgi:ferredoxin
MRITVDRERCQGHAKCWGELPEVFELDDEGFASASVTEVPVELEARALMTVQNCPERAISTQE